MTFMSKLKLQKQYDHRLFFDKLIQQPNAYLLTRITFLPNASTCHFTSIFWSQIGLKKFTDLDEIVYNQRCVCVCVCCVLATQSCLTL